MGSPNGIWTAVSGGMAQSQKLDVIANNLANAGTTGFKKDETLFKEYLTAYEQPVDPVIDIPRTAFKDNDFYHYDGRDQAMVNLNGVHTDHSQGVLRATSNPLDVAIDGQGFFAIQTPQGVAFTRNGQFHLSSEGQLVTTEGYPVLGVPGSNQELLNAEDGPTPAPTPGVSPSPSNASAVVGPAQGPIGTVGATPNSAVAVSNSPFAELRQVGRTIASLPASPPIQSGSPSVGPGTQPQGGDTGTLQPIVIAPTSQSQRVHISPQGQISLGGEVVGSLLLAEFAEPQRLKKMGSHLYANPDPASVPQIAKRSLLQQGFLEGSNVNAVSEVTEMIKANRMFESSMRAIRMYNDMATKEANEVGKL